MVRRLIGEARKHESGMLIVVFALYAFLDGLSLMLTHDAFAKVPVYRLMAEARLDDNLVGASMVVDAALLMVALATAPITRALVVFLSCLLWCVWSGAQFISGLTAGYLGPAACWSILIAIWLMSNIARLDVMAASPSNQ